MTLDQLLSAYKAVHDGVAPDAAAQARLNYFVQLSANQPSDAAAMSYIVNSADNSTALAALSYQFFTGKAPTKAGIDYLVNSTVNDNDLHDRYYSGLGLENRYINFSANLGVQGEGAAAFATKYGSLSFSDYVASIYQTIVGGAYATAAGIDPAKAIADIVSRKDAILATATSAGMIPANATAAQIDIALKAATAGYLMGEAIKADIGIYASAANNLMVAMALGTATYGTDITKTYAQPAGALGGGAGVTIAPNFVFPAPVVTPPADTGTVPAVPRAFALTVGADAFNGGNANDTFTGALGTTPTLNAADVLAGAGGDDTLSISSDAVASFTFDPAKITGIEHLRATATGGALNLDLGGIAFTDLTNVGSTQAMTFHNAAPTSALWINNTTFRTVFDTPSAGLTGGADAITLKLDTVTSGVSINITVDTPTANEYETINIVSNSGGPNFIFLGTDSTQTSLATINISGSAGLILNFAGGGDHINSSVTTLDAHALTGLLMLRATSAIRTIIGGSGIDVIQLGATGVNAQSGATITTGAGTDLVRFVGNAAAGTGASTDVSAFARITDFSIARDAITFSAEDADFILTPAGGTAQSGLARGIVAQGYVSGNTLVLQTQVQNLVGATPASNVSFIKLTQAVAFHTDIKTTFADAIGTGSILHLASNGNYLVSVYDTTNHNMIIAVVNTGGNANGDDTLDAADFTNAGVAVVGVIGMADATVYASFNGTHLS